MITRCKWVTADPLYLDYHDREWGVPQHDSRMLFEMLCLEGQQAGLSWITVLKKRACYRTSFHGFDPHKIAAMGGQELDALMQEPGLIRHRRKLEAIVTNARAWVAMAQAGEDFAAFIWQFVGHQPQVNRPHYPDIPAKTAASEALSRALKQRGFTFVGATICYAFMQACGLVNDHHVGCDLCPAEAG